MFDKRCRCPVHITVADITYEIRQQKRAVFAMIYLWVELYTPCQFSLDMKSRCLYFMSTGHKGEGRGNYRNRIAMRHPYGGILPHTAHEGIVLIMPSQIGTTIFPGIGRLDLPPRRMSQELRPITNAKYRIDTTDTTQIDKKGIRIRSPNRDSPRESLL